LPRLYSDGAEVAVVDAELLRLPLEHDQEGVDDEGLPRPEAGAHLGQRWIHGRNP
jgi:hypothetical protein